MGAYENPPLIIQPNYGEIFAQNAQNIMAIAEQRKEEAARKRKEKEARILQAGEKTSAYVRRANNIKAGALTENITQAALGFGDKKFEIEDAFAKGQLSAEEYNEANFKLEASLSTLASAGSALVQFENTIKDLDLSSYQTNPEVFGLIQAYKDGAVDFEIIDGKVELHYEIEGQKIEVDESWLSNPNSWNVVEKFDSDTVTSGLADVVKKQITEQASTTIQTDDAKVTTTEERYSEAYGTREQRLNQLLNNPIITGLDKEELGSYYKDRIVPNMSEDVENELNNILNSENYKNLSEEQKKEITNSVAEGKWLNKEFNINGTTVKSSNILGLLSKTQLAKEALNKVPPPKRSVATAIDRTTPEVIATPNVVENILSNIESAGENALLQQFGGEAVTVFEEDEETNENIAKRGKVLGITKTSPISFNVSVEIGSGKNKAQKNIQININEEKGQDVLKEIIVQKIENTKGVSSKVKEASLMSINNNFDSWVNSLINNTEENLVGPIDFSQYITN